MMETDILRAELERLFELDELIRLSKDFLGFEPELVGGTAAKASFAGALTAHCAENDAIEALCDALLATRSDVSQRVAEIRTTGLPFDEELPDGGAIGPFTNLKKLGEGRLAFSYVGLSDGVEHRVKVLRREATRDRRGLHRFLTVTRLVASIDHRGLPRRLATGSADGRVYVAHEHVRGVPLAERLSRTGALFLNEARDLLYSLLEALAALHARRLSHGDLRLENVLVVKGASDAEHAVLVDAGSDRLRSRPRLSNGRSELFSTASSPKTASPEQIRGYSADPRSDVYSFGALVYELLSGKAPFGEKSALESAFGHLSQPPDPPSRHAPRGFVSPELDALVLRLLAKDPKDRPADAAAVLELFDQLTSADAPREGLSSEAVDALVAKLAESPLDEDTARALESGASGTEASERAAEALRAAAGALPDDAATETKKALLVAGARVAASRAPSRALAEALYAEALALAHDDDTHEKLRELRRRLGKFDEVVEMLLAESERAENASEKARIFSEIGRIYASELADEEQARVAFAHAFSENPSEPSYAAEIERLAGSTPEAWTELLENATAAAHDDARPPPQRVAILNRVARWWADRAGRPDLALGCYQAVLGLEPANDVALAGVAQLYKKGQQWHDLGMALTRRAEAASSPALARDLRAEAAEILDRHLNDASNARALYEQVLADDPGHVKAAAELGRLYERTSDFSALVRLLETNVETHRGEQRVRAAQRIAELYETKLDDPEEAIRRYRALLELDPRSTDALRGLERLYQATNRPRELLENLERQIDLSPTPRQKIELLERAAKLHAGEFLDQGRAAEVLEQLLAIDPSHEPALTALAGHYRALARWEDAIAILERLSKQTDGREAKLALLADRALLLLERAGSSERALRAYEELLELDRENAIALEAIAKLREGSGDADAALTAIETLAARAPSREVEAEQWLRAARILEGRGDAEGAIERFKRALDANPKSAAATAALREAYAARGDVHAAVQLLDRELEHTDGALAKAALLGRMAALYRERLRDDRRAEECAKKSAELDPTRVDALAVLGDMAFENKRFLEASRHYEGVLSRVDGLGREEATRLLLRAVESFAEAGAPAKALSALEALLRVAPDDRSALERAADVTFEHGAPERAAELYAQIDARFGPGLEAVERARIQYRRGQALQRAGRLDEAVQPLEEAADLDPALADALVALGKGYEQQEKWSELLKVKSRHLDMASGEERVQLLLEVADISSGKLGDRTQAVKSLVAALDERPDDRRLLTKLMQLYGEEKDWNKLVEVVLRLAGFVDDPKQRVKYLHTAAIVTARQIGDAPRALDFYREVLELEPEFERAIAESIELERERSDHAAVERLLRRKLELATSQNDPVAMIDTFDQLGRLYEKDLGWTEQAVDAYEAAQTLDPDNAERGELLVRLYGADPERYLDKAVNAELALLRKDPRRAESYKTLRRLYTETKRADAAWCLCQALSVQKLAEPDEERFYKRMRSDTAAPAQNALGDEEWLSSLMHPDADPLLTSVFALIEPAVIAKRSQSLIELGYDERFQLDPGSHAAPICQSLYYAAGVFGVPLPPVYENPNDPGGISFLFSHEPSMVLGETALRRDLPLQPAAFIAAHKLTYFRPGMYVRHLLASGTALKAWLFAAIKLTSPQFPLAPELEGAVLDAQAALDAGIQGQARDHLTRVVSKLLTSGAALDLKRWVAAVDLTADRAGFVAAHDLAMAVQVIRVAEDGSGTVSADERIQELTLFSVSPEYFEVRRRLGIAVDS